MAFKKQRWIPYGRKPKAIEIHVKDSVNQTIDFFKIYINKGILEKNDRDDNPKKVLKILEQKYGINFGLKERNFLQRMQKNGFTSNI